MVDKDDFGLFAYKYFRKFSKKYAKEVFSSIKGDLQKSGIKTTLEEYFSKMLLIIAFASPVLLILGAIFTYVLTKNVLFSAISGILFFIISALGIFAYFFIGPSNTVAERAKKIDNGIHFATLYMATLANTGTPAFVLFKVISEFKEFGEISKVAQKITDEVEVFGYNLPDSLLKHAELSSSNNLSELLWGIRATIISGGDLSNYLTEKSKTFTGSFKRKIEEYVQTMSLFMEMYITVVIVGTIFVIVLSTIMSMVGGVMQDIQMLQLGFVALLVPFITIAFILFLKTVNPTEV
ncbi:MAG: type II secretion system F family protein [Candidatus Nanoarchaeia archaeon]|nr:type II secretion system F family protein [Candidatus Nanoarchaeia archaeon]MDD5499892.1 type II secretion system F family protein [Candidatus Nanoarchaeia archaeon]